MNPLLTKIKQFAFYLGYELSLFQKVTAGLLAVGVVGFLGVQATGLIANLSGGLLKSSVTSDSDSGGLPPMLSITNVDRSSLATDGTLAVKYAVGTKPDGPYQLVATVTSEEVEIGKGQSESPDQAGVVVVQVEEAQRGAASFTVRVTAEGNGQSLSDSVTIVWGASQQSGNAPPATATGAILPTIEHSPEPSVEPVIPTPHAGSGAVLPPGFGGNGQTSIPIPTPTGSGSLTSPAPVQCSATGKACATDSDCCSQRCLQLKVSTPGVKVCLPKR